MTHKQLESLKANLGKYQEHITHRYTKAGKHYPRVMSYFIAILATEISEEIIEDKQK